MKDELSGLQQQTFTPGFTVLVEIRFVEYRTRIFVSSSRLYIQAVYEKVKHIS